MKQFRQKHSQNDKSLMTEQRFLTFWVHFANKPQTEKYIAEDFSTGMAGSFLEKKSKLSGLLNIKHNKFVSQTKQTTDWIDLPVICEASVTGSGTCIFVVAQAGWLKSIFANCYSQIGAIESAINSSTGF